ncbi:MAG TPA: hypothetical protein VGP68_19110 [Gemmataceae bacterium]|jgi:hypothetical protein|nr:hypothetical protein [Gemmataceae bacterium]
MIATIDNKTRRPLASLGIIAFFVCSGCGTAPPPMNNDVQGTVKVNGTPLAGVMVEFVPDGVSGLLSGSAITDGQGHYEMQTGDHPGAVIGKHHVILIAGRSSNGRGNDPQAAQPDENNPAPPTTKGSPRIPPGYSDLRKPLLKVEVTPDKHTDYDLELGKGR